MKDKPLRYEEVAGAVHDWRVATEEDPEAKEQLSKDATPLSTPLVDAELDEEVDSVSNEIAASRKMRLRSHKTAYKADSLEDYYVESIHDWRLRRSS